VKALVGALARRGDVDPRTLARAVARGTCRSAETTSRVLFEQGAIALHLVETAPTAGRLAEAALSGGGRLFVAGRPAIAPGGELETFGACAGDTLAEPPSPDRRWIAIVAQPDRGMLRVLGDRLGISWLYIAETPDAFLFGPDYGALLAALPSPPRVDRETALVTLALAYAPDDRTCHEGVRLLPGGTLLELSAAGSRVVVRRRPRYGDGLAGESRDRHCETLDRLLEESAATWLPPGDDGLLLSLSGGNDSKYGVHLLRAAGRRAENVTFGHPWSSDARAARALSDRLGWRSIRYYEGDATDWDSWRKTIDQIGTTGGFQWSGWAAAWCALLKRRGRHVMLGFLGDALSGRHLVPGKGDAWLDHWLAWSLDEGWADAPVLHPEAARTMRDATRARFESMVSDLDTAWPHQRALHLDWYARQRRHVAAQPNLLDRHVEPVLFFYTGAMLDFWSNLPWEELRGQSLYLDYARRRAPDLWPPARPPSIPGRAWGFARNALAAAVPAWRRALLPTEIDNARIIAQNRATLVDLVRDRSEHVALVAEPERVVRAVRAFPGGEMTSFQILRLVNWLLVLRPGVPAETSRA
jgi:hypothetical protein